MSGAGNVERARAILAELARFGVRDVCLCAGARNAPFVAALDGAQGLRRLSFFEERSAAFFALGRARRDARPVAVIVTSGTAAAELLPAAIEGHYSGTPIALVTADRPVRLQGTGAPQTIEQPGLFRAFVELELDLDGRFDGHRESQSDAAQIRKWSGRGPLHVNVRFDEPLLDSPPRVWAAAHAASNGSAGARAGRRQGVAGAAGSGSRSVDQAKVAVRERLLRSGRPLAIVGALNDDRERAAARGLLLSLRAPIYAEAQSGLREDPSLAALLLRSGDGLLPWAMKRNLFDCVLRLGGVPTARLWRDLEKPSCAIPVASIGRLPFPGLGRCDHAWGEFADICAEVSDSLEPRSGDAALFDKDRASAAALEAALIERPGAEPALVRALSLAVAPDAFVYVGNSLPIREWDLAASRERPVWASASRGANGIDGQVSTFLGGVCEGREAWGLFGDLTALYDLAGPWARAFVPNSPARIAVLNNGGGKIFSRVFADPAFENRHSIRFDGFARGWGLPYERWTSVPHRPSRALGLELIELVPDEGETQDFWRAYDALWAGP